MSASALLTGPALANPNPTHPMPAAVIVHPAGEIFAHRSGAATSPFSLNTTPQLPIAPPTVFRTGAFYTSPFANSAFGFGFGPNGLPICNASAFAPTFFDGIPSDPYMHSCSSNAFNRFISQPSDPLAPGENPNALYGRSFSPTNLLQ